ncbi:glucosaminidase domain-containing protein [Sulfurimonas sp.]
MLTKIYITKKIRYIVLSIILFSINLLHADTSVYKYRKYPHVKKFYKEITPIAIKISKQYNLPAASLLAIAGLESGYGRGYVCQITGNIMSLGAFKGDPELPALTLPYSKTAKKILFDKNEIKKYTDLEYKKRHKSLKKDYRPLKYAGTVHNLTLLKYNKKLRYHAHYTCLNDFATKWICKKSNKKVFKNAKVWLETLVARNSKNILFNMDANNKFIEKIGGMKNSFNYRKSWPTKVKQVMKKAGLVELVDNIENKHMNFDEAWEQK